MFHGMHLLMQYPNNKNAIILFFIKNSMLMMIVTAYSLANIYTCITNQR